MATKGRRILIVDDDHDVIAVLRHHLVAAGYGVHHAFDGVDALAIAVREVPDLAISAVRMPGFDGFGLLAALRANATTRAMPIVILAASGDADCLARAARLGVDGHLPKPVRRDALLEMVAGKLDFIGGFAQSAGYRQLDALV